MRSLLFVFILSTTTFGCTRKRASEVELTAGKAGGEHATGQQATNPHAADDKATEDLQAQQAAEAKVVDQKAAADADAVKAHAATHTQLQASFDAKNRRFNELKQRIAKLPTEKQKKARAAATVVEADEATVMANIAKLRDAALTQWDAAKANVDTSSEALSASIDALEKTL